MIQKPPKKKKCKICREVFQPSRMIQPVCDNYECKLSYAIQHANKSRTNAARAERKKTREAMLRIKTKSQWLKELQVIVNKYVRLRDINHGCISCYRGTSWGGQWHASHYKSTGANSALRFNLWNIHKSCSICNNHLSGNISEYRPRLIEKIGIKKVEWLEAHDRIKSYDIEYIKRFKSIFSKKVRILEKRLSFIL